MLLQAVDEGSRSKNDASDVKTLESTSAFLCKSCVCKGSGIFIPYAIPILRFISSTPSDGRKVPTTLLGRIPRYELEVWRFSEQVS